MKQPTSKELTDIARMALNKLETLRGMLPREEIVKLLASTMIEIATDLDFDLKPKTPSTPSRKVPLKHVRSVADLNKLLQADRAILYIFAEGFDKDIETRLNLADDHLRLGALFFPTELAESADAFSKKVASTPVFQVASPEAAELLIDTLISYPFVAVAEALNGEEIALAYAASTPS